MTLSVMHRAVLQRRLERVFAGMGDDLLDIGKPVGDVGSAGNCARELLAGYTKIAAEDWKRAGRQRKRASPRPS